MIRVGDVLCAQMRGATEHRHRVGVAVDNGDSSLAKADTVRWNQCSWHRDAAIDQRVTHHCEVPRGAIGGVVTHLRPSALNTHVFAQLPRLLQTALTEWRITELYGSVSIGNRLAMTDEVTAQCRNRLQSRSECSGAKHYAKCVLSC